MSTHHEHHIDDELVTLLRAYVPDDVEREERPILAGSSIHFDHSFLNVHVPKFAKCFSHRHYDVSAVKLFCQSQGMPKFEKALAHRAKADIEESVQHAKECNSWLQTNAISKLLKIGIR